MGVTREDLERCIGQVTLSFADVESALDRIILTEYRAQRPDDFVTEVLADDGFSFGLRVNIVAKIVARRGIKEYEKVVQEVRALGNKRNLFAHTGKIAFLGGKLGYFDPKKAGQVLDPEKLCEEAQTVAAKCNEVRDRLKELADKLA